MTARPLQAQAKSLAFAGFNLALLPLVERATTVRNGDDGPVLVVQLNKIGDFVLTTPLIRAAAALAGDRGVVLAVSSAAANLAETCPYAEEVVVVPTRIGRLSHLPGNLRAVQRAAPAVRRLEPGVALVGRWSADVAFELVLARLSGAPQVVGFCEGTTAARQRRNRGYGRLMTACDPGAPGANEAVQQLRLLPHVGGPAGASPETEVWLTDEDRATAAKVAPVGSGAAARELLAVAPGAGTPHRRWPPERFGRVAAELAPTVAGVVVVGGAEDRPAAARIVAQVPGAVDLTGRLTLRQTAAVLERSSLCVANDSGLAHLAAAVRTPLVWISPHPRWAPADHDNAPERYAPADVPISVLRPMGAPTCAGGCEQDRPHCILEIGEAEVVAAAHPHLAAL